MDQGSVITNLQTMSLHHWGENPAGKWTMKLRNVRPDINSKGSYDHFCFSIFMAFKPRTTKSIGTWELGSQKLFEPSKIFSIGLGIIELCIVFSTMVQIQNISLKKQGVSHCKPLLILLILSDLMKFHSIAFYAITTKLQWTSIRQIFLLLCWIFFISS